MKKNSGIRSLDIAELEFGMFDRSISRSTPTDPFDVIEVNDHTWQSDTCWYLLTGIVVGKPKKKNWT